MTNAAQPPPRSAAQFWLNQLPQKAFEEVISSCGKEGAKQFRYMREALLPALHLRKPDPDARLADYQQRPDATWALLREIFPERYREQTRDWRELEQKVARGEMKPPAPIATPPAPPPLPAITEGIRPNVPKAEDLAALRNTEQGVRNAYPAPAARPAGPSS